MFAGFPRVIRQQSAPFQPHSVKSSAAAAGATLLEEFITMILFQSYRHTGASVYKLGPEGCVTEQVTV